MLLLVLLVVVLPLAELLIVHQVSEGLRGDGHHVGEDEAAVTAGCQHQLVVAVVVADTPYPEMKKNKNKTKQLSLSLEHENALTPVRPKGTSPFFVPRAEFLTPKKMVPATEVVLSGWLNK